MHEAEKGLERTASCGRWRERWAGPACRSGPRRQRRVRASGSPPRRSRRSSTRARAARSAPPASGSASSRSRWFSTADQTRSPTAHAHTSTRVECSVTFRRHVSRQLRLLTDKIRVHNAYNTRSVIVKEDCARGTGTVEANRHNELQGATGIYIY